MKNKTFLHHLYIFLYLSIILSNNSHVFLYINGLKPCIEHFDIFWNIWNLVLWREAGKKRRSCSDDSKFGAFILGQSEQQFKIDSHFGISDPVVGEGQFYYDASSHALKFICELFGNIWFFYSIKLFLVIVKSRVDAELIYNSSSFANCDILRLLRSDWSNMALLQVFQSYVILCPLLIGYIYSHVLPKLLISNTYFSINCSCTKTSLS